MQTYDYLHNCTRVRNSSSCKNTFIKTFSLFQLHFNSLGIKSMIVAAAAAAEVAVDGAKWLYASEAAVSI